MRIRQRKRSPAVTALVVLQAHRKTDCLCHVTGGSRVEEWPAGRPHNQVDRLDAIATNEIDTTRMALLALDFHYGVQPQGY